MNYLFHSGTNKSKVSHVLGDIRDSQINLFGSYYGRAILHFLEPNTTPNK